MKTILVLTDFSIRAGYAAKFAMYIAAKIKANILLCHVMESIYPVSDNGEFNRSYADQAILRNESILDLKAIARYLEKLIPAGEAPELKPSINYITNFGPLEEVVKKIIGERRIDLVVAGSHKSNSLSRLLFGSHTHAILDKINCPVLLVPESLQFNGINTIAYATDLTFDNQTVMQYLAEFAKSFNSTISVNHISPLDFPVKMHKNITGSLNKHLKTDYPPVLYKEIVGDNVKESLLEMTDSDQIDILAMVHRRYDFFGRLFHSSISKHLADNAKVPLLILPHSFSMDVPGLSSEQLDRFCYEAGDSR